MTDNEIQLMAEHLEENRDAILAALYKETLERISGTLKANGVIWGYSGEDELFHMPAAIVRLFDERRFMQSQIDRK